MAVWCVGLALGPQFVGMDAIGIRVGLLVWLYVPITLLHGPQALLTPLRVMRTDGALVLGTLIVALVANAGVSIDPTTSVQFSALTLAALHLTAALWCVREEGIAGGIKLAAVAITLFYVIPGAEASVAHERLSYGRNPNSIGLIMLFAAASVFLWRQVLAKWIVVTATLAIIMTTGSRSALIGSALGIAAASCLSLRRRMVVVVLGATAVVVLGIGFGDQVAGRIWDPLRTILALDDRYRGLNSGFTGRLEAWSATYQIWKDNPFLGCGYRTHEQILTDTSATSSHNGYLSMLAELGLFGATPAFLLVAVGIWRVGKEHVSDLARTGLALSVGYCFIAAFERYFFNLGNQTSVMFMFFSVAPALLGTGSRNEVENATVPGGGRKVAARAMPTRQGGSFCQPQL